MSGYASPFLASGTAVDSSGRLTLPFQNWFKRLGDDWTESNRITVGDDASYARNGNMVFWSRSGESTGQTIHLPYPLAMPAILQTVFGASVTHTAIAAGASAVTLPNYGSGNTTTSVLTYICTSPQGGK